MYRQDRGKIRRDKQRRRRGVDFAPSGENAGGDGHDEHVPLQRHLQGCGHYADKGRMVRNLPRGGEHFAVSIYTHKRPDRYPARPCCFVFLFYSQQIPDTGARDHQAPGGGDEGNAAGRLAAGAFFVFFFILEERGKRLFCGAEHLQVRDPLFFEFPAHDARERADRRFGKVGYFQPGRVELVAGAHAADDGDMKGNRPPDQSKLGGDGVDRVDDIIAAGKVEVPGVFRGIKHGIGRHRGMRVDGKDAFLHDVHLETADGLLCGDELAVDIAFCDRVAVKQKQAADAAAAQRLTNKGADAADTEHGNAGAL